MAKWVKRLEVREPANEDEQRKGKEGRGELELTRANERETKAKEGKRGELTRGRRGSEDRDRSGQDERKSSRYLHEQERRERKVSFHRRH